MEPRENREWEVVTALDDTGNLTCPRCSASFADLNGELGADASEPTEQIHVDIECFRCDAPLASPIESAMSEAVSANMWVEDRRGESDS